MLEVGSCCLVFVFSDASVDEVRQCDEIVLCHVFSHQGREGAGKAATEVEVETEGDSDEEGGDADNNDDKLLAKESGEETATEESTQETIVTGLGGSSRLVSDRVVVIVVSLVADGGCLGSSVAVGVG